MFRRILVALDGSRFSESALPAALRFARRRRTELRLVTVADADLVFGNDTGWTFVDRARGDEIRAGSERYLERLRTRLSHLVPQLTTKLREGFPAEEILREADEFRADLLVMATHGRGRLSRIWLGSVADQCVHHAGRPVLLVRGDESGHTPPGSLDTRRVVVPLDGSPRSEGALGVGVGITAAFGGRMHLMRMVHDLTVADSEFFPDTVAHTDEIVAHDEAEASAYLEQIARPLREWGLVVDAHVGAVADAASGILGQAGSDLIVIATRGRAGLQRALLGSVTDAVIRGAVGPVLVIPPRIRPGRAARPVPGGEVESAPGS